MENIFIKIKIMIFPSFAPLRRVYTIYLFDNPKKGQKDKMAEPSGGPSAPRLLR
jgi:hypothetical protein